jgi:hypothetical protein
MRPPDFKRVLNPNIVKAKGRPSGSPNKKKSKKAKNSSTERDSSHHKILFAEVTGDSNQLKGIYREKRLQKTPISKTTKPATTKKTFTTKAAAKKATITERHNYVETVDLTGDNNGEMQESAGDSNGEMQESAGDSDIKI